MTWRAPASLASAVAIVACQSAPISAAPGATDAASGAPRAPATVAQSPAPVTQSLRLELTYLRRCTSSPQPRRVSVSAESSRLTIVDEAGEARQAAVSPAELAALADALRRAQFLKMVSHAGKGRGDGCAVTISAGIDGSQNSVEESGTSRVDAAQAADWKSVQAAVEALMAAHP